MTRFPLFICLVFASFVLFGADGCSSDPNVEGAKLDLKNKDYDRALQNLETALQTNPDNVDALELKGRVIGEMILGIRDIDEHTSLLVEMLDSYDRALLLDPTLDETITQAIRIAYSNEFTMGSQAFNRGQNDDSEYATSAAFFKNAARIQPDSSGAYVNQAYAHMNGGESAAAIQPFEKALEKGDTEKDTFRFLASLYQSADRFEEAVTVLESAGELYPDDEELQKELLNAYQLADQTDRALEMYSQAVEKDPQNKLFRYNYGTLLTMEERYDEAIEQLQAAVAVDPEYINAHYNLATAYINQAVQTNEELTAMDDAYREKLDSMSQAEKDAENEKMNVLADHRRELFGLAISPLESALELMNASDEDPKDICVALYQSYVQTNALDKAEGVSGCAGFDD